MLIETKCVNKASVDITWNNSHYRQQPTITSKSIQLSTMHQPWGRTKKQKKNGCYSHFVVHSLLSACNVLQSLVWSYFLLIFLWVGAGCLFLLHSPTDLFIMTYRNGFLNSSATTQWSRFHDLHRWILSSGIWWVWIRVQTIYIDRLTRCIKCHSSLSEDECKVFLWYIRVQDA